MSTPKSPSLRLVWHRRDLRLHDNILYDNLQTKEPAGNTKVISLYVFNQSDYLPRKATCCHNGNHGLEWTAVNIGPHAGRIQIESVRDLRESLRNIGGELLVRCGCPTKILPDIVQELSPTEVVWNDEPGFYESTLSRRVWKSIRSVSPDIPIRTDMQYTLYHPNDLPSGQTEWQSFCMPKNRKKKKRSKESQSISQSPPPRRLSHTSHNNARDHLVDVSAERWRGIPRIMGEFRKAAREASRPRTCLQAPTRLSIPDTSLSPGDIPTLHDLYAPLIEYSRSLRILGMSPATIEEVLNNAKEQESAPDRHRGGERTAMKHLQDFCEHHAATAVRNLACVDNHQSSRISHSLAFGCLSPRFVVSVAENNGPGCNWIISHMTMRDFFLYTCLASGTKFYHLEGIPVSQKNSQKLVWQSLLDARVQTQWRQWALGDTGLPLVDAAMKELLATGYCSNRVRQNAASVLTKDLGIDWRAGTEWFQFLLEDHCVGANWGNWLYFSGVGPDPKHRHFRTVSQALKYDPDGSYVRRWLPKLCQIEGDEAYLRPWDYDTVSWKEPIVAPQSQYIWQDLQRLNEEGFLIEHGREASLQTDDG